MSHRLMMLKRGSFRASRNLMKDALHSGALDGAPAAEPAGIAFNVFPRPCMGFGLSRGEVVVERAGRPRVGRQRVGAGCGCAEMTVDSAVCRESGKIRITLYPVGRDSPDLHAPGSLGSRLRSKS
jgi:hypothetical protein